MAAGKEDGLSWAGESRLQGTGGKKRDGGKTGGERLEGQDKGNEGKF